MTTPTHRLTSAPQGPLALAGLLLTLSLLAPAIAQAKKPLEDALRRDWQGTWVVTTSAVSSACGELFTNNQVLGTRVVGDGSERLEAGELGQVYKVNVKRKRVDVLIELAEPLLVPYTDGPFELFREAQCRVELRLGVPRDVVKAGQPDPVNTGLAAVLRRYDQRADALDDEAYNGRQRAPYPPGYEETLAAYDAWRLEQVSVRLGEVLEEAHNITRSMPTDDAYAAGFVQGMRQGKSVLYGGACFELVSRQHYPSSGTAPADHTDEATSWQNGYRDGQIVGFDLALARELQRCLG